MSEIVESLRTRIQETIPVVAEGITGDAPFAYQEPNPTDEIKAFLNLGPQQRQQLFQRLGPDQYQDWSTSMMKKLNNKFGSAAQLLMPMLEGVQLENLASGGGLDTDGSMGVAAAQAELIELLGFDPLS
jgi:hypothetical protein